MNPDLEHLIALQRLDSTALDATRRLAGASEQEKAFDARLQLARDRVAAAKQHLSANQEARRAIEKEVAVHQGRLSKFREQAMAVKTNVEYHAVQKEIAFAQNEIKTLEEKILEHMLEADELSAQAKRVDAELASEQKTIDADRKKMVAEHAELTALLERIVGQRAAIVAALDQRRVLAPYFRSSPNAGTVSPSPKHATASAQSVTCGSGPRCSTTSCAARKSCSATAASAFCTARRRRQQPQRQTSRSPRNDRGSVGRVYRRGRQG